MVREAEWQEEGRKEQPDERLLPGSRGEERQEEGREEGKKEGREEGKGGPDFSLEHQPPLQLCPIPNSLFLLFLPVSCLYLSLLSPCVSLPVLAACLCFTLSNQSGILRPLCLSPCISLSFHAGSFLFLSFPLCLLLSLLMAVCLHVFLGWLSVCLSILSSQAAGNIPCIH